MAILQNIISKEIIVLETQHIFGRNKQIAKTCVHSQDVSQSHATIFWKCGFWYLKDHSRNGTLINNKFYHQTTYKFHSKEIIQFGEKKSTQWMLIDNTPPSCYFKSLTNKNKVIPLPSVLDLLHQKKQDIHIYCAKNRQWKAEKEGKTIPLTQGVTLHFNNDEWVFIENQWIDDIIDYGHIVKEAYYQFILSADEEHITIQIISNTLVLDLGTRVHNYLLLSLARKRLSDVSNGYSENDQGWFSIEEIAYDLSKEFSKEIDAYYINLQIYRIRKHIAKIEPYGYLFANVIERKNGFIRFSHPYLKLIKENESIGEILVS